MIQEFGHCPLGPTLVAAPPMPHLSPFFMPCFGHDSPDVQDIHATWVAHKFPPGALGQMRTGRVCCVFSPTACNSENRSRLGAVGLKECGGQHSVVSIHWTALGPVAGHAPRADVAVIRLATRHHGCPIWCAPTPKTADWLPWALAPMPTECADAFFKAWIHPLPARRHWWRARDHFSRGGGEAP